MRQRVAGPPTTDPEGAGAGSDIPGSPRPAPSASQGPEARLPAFAALDLGSNNCRLLVAVPGEGGFRVIDAFSRIVRLGEGIARDGVLCQPAIERTLTALRVCASKIRRNRVAASRCVATAACREAANCDDFLDLVADGTGLRLEIISAGEEARLAIAGCLPLLDFSHRHGLVFDIGGGSTEVIWLALDSSNEATIVETLSLPCGVVTFAEEFGGHEVPDPVWQAMVGHCADALAAFDARHGIADRIARGEVQMLGTSGTVTTLSALHLGLGRYSRDRVDGSSLGFDDFARVTDRLRALDWEGRAALPCIGRARADLVLAGAAILEAICQQWPVGRMHVADRGLREGMLVGLIGQHTDRPCARRLNPRGR